MGVTFPIDKINAKAREYVFANKIKELNPNLEINVTEGEVGFDI